MPAPAHEHSHSHHEHLSVAHYGRAFLIGISLNVLFVGVEWTYGWLANSLALMADAAHNLGDVLGLVLAWGGTVLAQRRPSAKFTYGLRGTSILAALGNSVLLLLVTGGLAWEAIQRFGTPQPVQGLIVIAVAALGIVINGITAWLFRSGSKGDLNLRGAYLHMAADAAVSMGVVVAGILVFYTGWQWLDPFVTLVLAAVIALSTWGLLRDSFQLAVQAVPEAINIDELRTYLSSLPGVAEVHDLHVWGMSTTENALTVHLLCPQGHPGDEFLQKVAHEAEHRFHIHHTTLQIEVGNYTQACALAPEHVV
jgi:cobalt-zinc-cadmium efflux system protein